MNPEHIIEAVLFTAGEPVSLERLQQLLDGEQKFSINEIKVLIHSLSKYYEGRGIELIEVASGYRFQTQANYLPWLQKLHAGKTMRYSRVFLETLALIVYRQPVTRGEIEGIRGVAVSSQIMKSLQELEWIRVLGYRDVPGKPALYGTTKKFLDDFNIRDLSELPPLSEIKSLTQLEQQLAEQLELIT